MLIALCTLDSLNTLYTRSSQNTLYTAHCHSLNTLYNMDGRAPLHKWTVTPGRPGFEKYRNTVSSESGSPCREKKAAQLMMRADLSTLGLHLIIYKHNWWVSV